MGPAGPGPPPKPNTLRKGILGTCAAAVCRRPPHPAAWPRNAGSELELGNGPCRAGPPPEPLTPRKVILGTRAAAVGRRPPHPASWPRSAGRELELGNGALPGRPAAQTQHAQKGYSGHSRGCCRPKASASRLLASERRERTRVGEWALPGRSAAQTAPLRKGILGTLAWPTAGLPHPASWPRSAGRELELGNGPCRAGPPPKPNTLRDGILGTRAAAVGQRPPHSASSAAWPRTRRR